MAQPVEIEIKAKGLGELKQELRSLKSELANATDPAEIERLSMAAGQLSDKISDVNEKVAIFAAGSDFEKVSNGLGLIGNQLANMDFEGASESAKLLTATIKDMNPKAIADGFKGFISTIGQLGNAFVQMGFKLIQNPIFLLVAIIGGIVAAIVMLKDKLKIAETAFNMMAAPIKVLIQLMKDLTDWIGITSFAEEEAAAKSLKAAEKRAAASKKLQGDLEADYDRRIALAKAEGKDTSKLETDKTKVVQNESAKRVAAYNAEIAAQRALLKGQTEEQQKETKAKIDELRKNRDEDLKVNRDAENEIKVIKANTAREAAEEAQKQREKDLDNQKRANEKKLAEEKRLRDEMNAKIREAAEKAMELESQSYQNILAAKKANSDALKTDRQKELDDAAANYDKQIELAKKTNQSTTDLEIAKTNALKEINDRYNQEERDKQASDFVNKQTKAFENLENEKLTFEERFKMIDEQQKLLNENTILNDEVRNAAQLEIDKNKKDQEVAFEQAKNEAIASSKENLNNIISGIEATGLAKTKAGQALSKAMALTQIGIDSAVALSKASTLANAEGAAAQLAFPLVPGIGTTARILSYASTYLSVASNIVKAKQLLSSGGSVGGSAGGQVGGGGAPTMATGASASATPNVQLTGNNTQLNETSQGQARVAAQPPQQNITVTAIVSETEMTSAQNRVSTIQRSAEL